MDERNDTGRPMPVVAGTARIEGGIAFLPDTDALVDSWFVEFFHNRGYDAPLFNHLRAAADDLKSRLRRE